MGIGKTSGPASVGWALRLRAERNWWQARCQPSHPHSHKLWGQHTGRLMDEKIKPYARARRLPCPPHTPDFNVAEAGGAQAGGDLFRPVRGGCLCGDDNIEIGVGVHCVSQRGLNFSSIDCLMKEINGWTLSCPFVPTLPAAEQLFTPWALTGLTGAYSRETQNGVVLPSPRSMAAALL